MDKKKGGTSKSGGSSQGNADGVLEERLGWVQKIGWWISGFYAVVFIGFVTWFLPKEFESSRNTTKIAINDAVEPVRIDIAKLTERLSKQVAFNLQGLIPPAALARTLEPDVLKARFQEADSLINTAIEQRIPATPALLKHAAMKLQTTIQDAKLAGDVRSVGAATLVKFEAYAAFSSTVVIVNAPKIVVSRDGTNYAPVTVDKPVWLEGTGKDGATITVDFTGTHPIYPHPAAFVVTGAGAVLSKMRARGKDSAPSFVAVPSTQSSVLVSETKIENLTQKLGGVTWINVDFVNSVIRYSGEPTYLGDVTFTNCRFEFGSDEVSRLLLARISRLTGPVTLASTAMF